MIGIFDSGVGGLSVFREIRNILPQESYIYYSDSANCPYGTKSKEFIIGRAREITEYLISEGADIIVIACNTATAAAIKTLRSEYQIPFIGMEPAIKPAVAMTRTGTIGVLATAGTLTAEKYRDTREKFADDVKVMEHIGQGFVELVENGKTSGNEAENTVSDSLRPLLEGGADVIVLGCTHYPFLTDVISKVSERLAPGKGVTIINPAPAVARHLHDVMNERSLIKNEGFRIKLVDSGDESHLKDFFYRYSCPTTSK